MPIAETALPSVLTLLRGKAETHIKPLIVFNEEKGGQRPGDATGWENIAGLNHGSLYEGSNPSNQAVDDRSYAAVIVSKFGPQDDYYALRVYRVDEGIPTRYREMLLKNSVLYSEGQIRGDVKIPTIHTTNSRFAVRESRKLMGMLGLPEIPIF